MKPASQPSSRTSTKTPQRTPAQRTPARGRAVPPPNAQRRAAKRRQAIGERLRKFDTALPAFGVQHLPRLSLDGAQLGFSGFTWSKLLSLALFAGALAALIWMQTDWRWYVYRDSVRISGLNRVSADEVFTLSGMDGWNLFWLQEDEIRKGVLRHPWISDVNVSLSVPSAASLELKEDPAIGLWVTDQGQYWISSRGAALPLTETPPVGMPRLIDADQQAAVPGSQPGSAVDTNIVASALALIERVPGVSEVRYNREIGLNFGLPGTNLWVYWGNGDRPEEKLSAIELGRRLVSEGENEGNILDVRFPEQPFLR